MDERKPIRMIRVLRASEVRVSTRVLFTTAVLEPDPA